MRGSSGQSERAIRSRGKYGRSRRPQSLKTGKIAMPGFWDASALVPLCVSAQNPGNSRRLLREYPPVVWWGSALETVSALARLRRQHYLTDAQHHAATGRLAALRKTW